jgi:hypothetical protein
MFAVMRNEGRRGEARIRLYRLIIYLSVGTELAKIQSRYFYFNEK